MLRFNKFYSNSILVTNSVSATHRYLLFAMSQTDSLKSLQQKIVTNEINKSFVKKHLTDAFVAKYENTKTKMGGTMSQCVFESMLSYRICIFVFMIAILFIMSNHRFLVVDPHINLIAIV